MISNAVCIRDILGTGVGVATRVSKILKLTLCHLRAFRLTFRHIHIYIYIWVPLSQYLKGPNNAVLNRILICALCDKAL